MHTLVPDEDSPTDMFDRVDVPVPDPGATQVSRVPVFSVYDEDDRLDLRPTVITAFVVGFVAGVLVLGLAAFVFVLVALIGRMTRG